MLLWICGIFNPPPPPPPPTVSAFKGSSVGSKEPRLRPSARPRQCPDVTLRTTHLPGDLQVAPHSARGWIYDTWLTSLRISNPVMAHISNYFRSRRKWRTNKSNKRYRWSHEITSAPKLNWRYMLSTMQYIILVNAGWVWNERFHISVGATLTKASVIFKAVGSLCTWGLLVTAMIGQRGRYLDRRCAALYTHIHTIGKPFIISVSGGHSRESVYMHKTEDKTQSFLWGLKTEKRICSVCWFPWGDMTNIPVVCFWKLVCYKKKEK